MHGARKLDGRKFLFNYRVDENIACKSKFGSARAGLAEQMRLSDIECALDELFAKHGGAGRVRLTVNYALGLFAVAEDAASISGAAAPLLLRCLQLLFDCVFSPEMTVIGTQLVHRFAVINAVFQFLLSCSSSSEFMQGCHFDDAGAVVRGLQRP
jgi:hypothetical protein